MKYYYIHPNKPQYFFPENFLKYPHFESFYQPFTIAGSISWILWKYIRFYRERFLIHDIEEFIPEKRVKELVGSQSIMAFNTGTPGPEQKITALGIKNNEKFFVKYAKNEISKRNVINEFKILDEIKHISFAPKVLDFIVSESDVILKTNFFEGKRFSSKTLNFEIINVLLKIASEKIKTERNYGDRVKSCFAHGDFCPWNMMIKDDGILIYDWEMGGNYSIGYDLFTYIFKTSFIMLPKLTVKEIMNQNMEFIKYYFNKLEINDWKRYLTEFVRITLEIEVRKKNKGIIKRYKELLEYAEKI